jgi:hypothetical protein
MNKNGDYEMDKKGITKFETKTRFPVRILDPLLFKLLLISLFSLITLLVKCVVQLQIASELIKKCTFNSTLQIGFVRVFLYRVFHSFG